MKNNAARFSRRISYSVELFFDYGSSRFNLLEALSPKMGTKKKNPKKLKAKTVKVKQQRDSVIGQKFALLLFGLGPVVLMAWFLFSKGFFDPI